MLFRTAMFRGKRIPPSDWNHPSGAAASELAILLPLVILFCLTSLDFGRFSYAYIALGNAGRVGAEYLATREFSSENAAAREQQMVEVMHADFASNGQLDPQQLNISLVVSTDTDGLHRFTVEATYPFRTSVSWPGIPRPLMLQQGISFRRFR
jgi:Flp pilus assembly protein TadG